MVKCEPVLGNQSMNVLVSAFPQNNCRILVTFAGRVHKLFDHTDILPIILKRKFDASARKIDDILSPHSTRGLKWK